VTEQPYAPDPAAGMTASYSSTASTRSDARPDVENDSLGSIVSRVTDDLSTLMRQELALAKAEMQAEAKTAGKAAGMLAGGGLAAWLTLVLLSFTVIWALDNVMNIAWAAFIVTVCWAIVAAVLLATGRSTLKKVNPKPDQTIESVKEDAQWLNPRKS
jgi:uncharacterized membrane protein YqjE